MSTTYPFYAVRFSQVAGDSFNYVCTVKDSAGALVDLTTATFDFELGSLTEASSGVTVTGGGSAGTVTIAITLTAMAAITAGDYDISLRYTIGTNQYTLFKGTFSALESVI